MKVTKLSTSPLAATCLLAACMHMNACSDQSPSDNAARAIPMPAGLDTADPLISRLINSSADQVKLTPDDSKAWAHHASALMANAYYEPSVESSLIALEIDPSQPRLLYRQAIARWRLNQQEEAVLDLQDLLVNSPLYDPGWRTLAFWQLEMGEIEEAESAARKAWVLKPARPGTLLVMAKVLLQDDRADEAVTLLEERLANPTAPPYLHSIAAQAYRQLGRTSDLESSIALAKPPPGRWPDPWLNEIALLATGRKMLANNSLDMLRIRGPQAAMPLLRQAIDADPANNDVRAGLAFAILDTGKASQSLKILDGIEPGSKPTLNYWKQYAVTCIELSKGEKKRTWLLKALEAFEEAMRIEESADLHRNAASIANSTGQNEKASGHFQRGGELLLDSGDYMTATEYLQLAVELSPGRRQALFLLSRAFVNTGRLDDARSLLQEHLSANPGDEEARELLRTIAGSGTP